MTPREMIHNLYIQAQSLISEMNDELSTPIESDESELIGDFLVRTLVPFGFKTMTRKAGRMAKRTHRDERKDQWRDRGADFLRECENEVRHMSIKTKNLPVTGNSSRLLQKFNRVRRIKEPSAFFNTLIEVLEELMTLDLIWNRDIPALKR